MMNEYEECLYNYILENKFRELHDIREYIMRRRISKKAECALEETLTAEQKRLFEAYMEEETAASSLELRHVFQITLALSFQLYHS